MAEKQGYRPGLEAIAALEAALKDWDPELPEVEVKKLARFMDFAAYAILNGKPERKDQK